MASIKVKFQPSVNPNLPGRLYYRIYHDRNVRMVPTSHMIYPSEWDSKRETPLVTGTADRCEYIRSIKKYIYLETLRFRRIINNLEQNVMDYTIDNLVEEMEKYDNEYTMYNLIQAQILKKRSNGKIRTSETYLATLNSFRKFRQGVDLAIDLLSSDDIERFESWQLRRGISRNTISFYNRVLRAVYNRAVDKGITENRFPFREVYTGVEQTVKRALHLSELKKIRSLDLSKSPDLEYARDMFMMSFFLRGMSFIDMAFLRKSELRNGVISYRRHKTGQLLNIKWIKDMDEILNRYPDNNSEYLFPILRGRNSDPRILYRNSSSRINRHLNRIAELAGMSSRLTIYCARHSWASIAKSRGIPINVISEALGHDSEATTRIYLASLDASDVDDANNRVIEAIKEL